MINIQSHLSDDVRTFNSNREAFLRKTFQTKINYKCFHENEDWNLLNNSVPLKKNFSSPLNCTIVSELNLNFHVLFIIQLNLIIVEKVFIR